MDPLSRRKFLASSSSEDYDTTTGMCSIEEFVASKDLYRAAPFQSIPTTYPFVEGVCSQKGANAVMAVEAQYMKVLETYNITYSSIQFHSLSHNFNRAGGIDTLIVETKDLTFSNWKEAASKILELFHTAGVQPDEIKVEIRNPARMYRNDSTCLPHNKELLATMREVGPRVLEIVQNELHGVWTTIGYLMRGPSDNASARKPTVVITCTPGSRHFFEKLSPQLQPCLLLKTTRK